MFFWQFEINALSCAKHFREKTEIDVNEFFERFKINKQVVQAGAPYVIYIWCTEKQEPSILILIDLESLSRLSTEQLEKILLQ